MILILTLVLMLPLPLRRARAHFAARTDKEYEARLHIHGIAASYRLVSRILQLTAVAKFGHL